jgi:hypothetical protein
MNVIIIFGTWMMIAGYHISWPCQPTIKQKVTSCGCTTSSLKPNELQSGIILHHCTPKKFWVAPSAGKYVLTIFWGMNDITMKKIPVEMIYSKQ